MAVPLVVIGAGGFGRETLEAARAVNRVQGCWDILGFADDDPAAKGRIVDGVEILGPAAEVISAHPEAKVVVTTGRPDNYFSRPRIVGRLALPDDRYATVVHPAASVAGSADVGPGSVVLAGTVVTAAASVGKHVAVMPGVVVTHDDVVGDFATLTSGVRLGGSVSVGRGAYIGSGALVREGLSIGEWALVGMGSVLTRHVPPREVWYGTPARFRAPVEVPPDLHRAGRP